MIFQKKHDRHQGKMIRHHLFMRVFIVNKLKSVSLNYKLYSFKIKIPYTFFKLFHQHLCCSPQINDFLKSYPSNSHLSSHPLQWVHQKMSQPQ
jgi:hypothetical protein